MFVIPLDLSARARATPDELAEREVNRRHLQPPDDGLGPVQDVLAGLASARGHHAEGQRSRSDTRWVQAPTVPLVVMPRQVVQPGP